MVQKMMPMEKFLLTFIVQALFDFGGWSSVWRSRKKKPKPKSNEQTEKKRKIF